MISYPCSFRKIWKKQRGLSHLLEFAKIFMVSFLFLSFLLLNSFPFLWWYQWDINLIFLFHREIFLCFGVSLCYFLVFVFLLFCYFLDLSFVSFISFLLLFLFFLFFCLSCCNLNLQFCYFFLMLSLYLIHYSPSFLLFLWFFLSSWLIFLTSVFIHTFLIFMPLPLSMVVTFFF